MASQLADSALAGGKTWKRTQRLMERVSAIATVSGGAQAVAWVTSLSGFSHYMVGEHRRGAELLARGEEMFKNSGGKGFEVARSQFYLLACLWHLGQLKEASRRRRAYFTEALERGDLFVKVNMRIGYSTLAWLMDDDPEGARRSCDDAMASWSKRGFQTEHQYELSTRVNIELYRRDPIAAQRILDDRLPAYDRSFLWRIQTLRIRTSHLRARVALTLAAAGHARDENMRLAARMARKIAREHMAWSDPFVILIRATLAKLRGDARGAIEGLRAAAAAFDSVDLALDAVVARHCLGKELNERFARDTGSAGSGAGDAVPVRDAGATEGDALLEGARAWLTAQTVKRPDRFVAMLAPGFDTAGFDP
jgi:hypothetical protein